MKKIFLFSALSLLFILPMQHNKVSAASYGIEDGCDDVFNQVYDETIKRVIGSMSPMQAHVYALGEASMAREECRTMEDPWG